MWSHKNENSGEKGKMTFVVGKISLVKEVVEINKVTVRFSIKRWGDLTSSYHG